MPILRRRKRMKRTNFLIIFGIIFGIITAIAAIAVTVVDVRNWEQFSQEHHCKATQKIKGGTSIGTGITSKGGVMVMPISEPDKTCYLCDDGVTYCR